MPTGRQSGLMMAFTLAFVLGIASGTVGQDADDHKDLVPLEWTDVGGITLLGLVTLIAAGGGIGGGGVLVPILILVMNFSMKAAIPLSSVTILG